MLTKGSDKIEIFPKDTGSDPSTTLRSAIELKELGINLVIGPVFYDNLVLFETFFAALKASYPELICIVM